MAVSTFSELKAEVLARASKLETCSLYQEILAAEDELTLLRITCGLYTWAYQNDVFSDDMFSIIGESNLNQYGIYSTGTYDLTNPIGFLGCRNYNLLEEEAPIEAQELYFANDVIATVNIDSGYKYVVNCFGDSQVTINIGDGSFAYIRARNNAQVTVNVAFTGNICIDTNEDAQTTIDADNTSVVRGRTFGRSVTSIVLHAGAYANFKTFFTSILNYALNDLSTIDLIKYQRSQINAA